MIFTIDAKNNVLLPMMKSFLNLDNKQVYYTINYEFDRMVHILKTKKINYNELKRALIPNQDKDKKELAFIFDTNLIDTSDYGSYIFNMLLPLLGKESTFSILAGDYIDVVNDQYKLKNILFEGIEIKNKTTFYHSSQYFVVYINNISNCQLNTIVTGMEREGSFVGINDLSLTSLLKTYLSYILTNVGVICKKNVILAHESDLDDSVNINNRGYPFEKNGFRIVSINEDLYLMFLSYKIDCMVPDLEDIKFSLNALCIDYSSLSNFTLVIEDEKHKYLNEGKKGIMESLGFDKISKENLIKVIYQKISENYIYNLDFLDKYNVIKFNVCAEFPTINGRLRRTTIALEYKPYHNLLRLITLT